MKALTLLFFLLCFISVYGQWQPKGDKIKTHWSAEVDPNGPHPEYPRPIMKRKDWKNLNGLWDFTITPYGSALPKQYEEQILVPFPIESSLSGIMKEVGEKNEAFYRTTFTIPDGWKEKVLLHFGAVDWRAEIWINDIMIGSHEGGYDPFYFDITPFLTDGNQKLIVKVWDPTSSGPQPRGKQVNKPRGIWYTPVTGIWQTVWLESVPKTFIHHVKLTPDIDRERITVKAVAKDLEYGDLTEVIVMDRGSEIAKARSSAEQPVEVFVNNPVLWSPENPYLYDCKIRLIRKGEVIDEVDSYFAMRKISRKKDEFGIERMQLNNKDCFHFGTLDQGWWPDGLYTAPTDEALKYDIQKTKDYGFNMIRKHVKVEPQRWYRHCDEIGMLVWQDMPNGDGQTNWVRWKMFDGNEYERSPKSEKIFRKEWSAIIDFLYSYPSIVVWVPFNESWGQFKTEEITTWTATLDPTRLINSASGGNHFKVGDILDLHNYPEPKLGMYDADRVVVMGEYGGIGLPMEGHLWNTDGNWGYIKFQNAEEATDEYVKYANMLAKLVPMGFSGAVYTQTTDVEGEVNGIMTYDRAIDKLDMVRVRQANEAVIRAIDEKK